MSNILRVSFKHERRIESRPLYQYDYGQILKFIDLELPYSYEVHFSNHEKGSSITQLGNENGVAIPDSLLTSGLPIYAWLYLHAGDADGETEYMVKIPVYKRAAITNDQPTPVQQDVITQTIAALASGVAVAAASASNAMDAATEATRQCGATRAYMETTQEYRDAAIAATSHYPKIEDDYWYVWDTITEQFINTDVPARGPKGEPFTYDDFTPEQLEALTGPQGATFTPSVSSDGVIYWENDGGKENPQSVNIMGPQGIQGETGPSGFSPVIAVSSIVGGHQVSITDASGTQSFDVMDGVGDVQSVNNKTGAVVLTAEDVGALPSDTEVGDPQNVWFGTCDTSSSSTYKYIRISGDKRFVYKDGRILVVYFTNSNTTTDIKLAIYYSETLYLTYPVYSGNNNNWRDRETVIFICRNGYFYMVENGEASTTYYGITKLSNSINSTSTTLAATANAVKTAYDKGNSAYNQATDALALASNAISQASNAYALAETKVTAAEASAAAPVQSVNNQTGNITLTAADIGALSSDMALPSKVSDLDNDLGFISTETDPTVPSWAKAVNKPTYTASEVNAIAVPTAASSGQLLGYDGSEWTAMTVDFNSLPSGGLMGQVLAKSSDDDYVVAWTSANSDWNNNDSSSLKYISNKPAIKSGTGTNAVIINDIDRNIASGNKSIAAGNANEVTGNFSLSLGQANKVNGSRSVAAGQFTRIDGNYNITNTNMGFVTSSGQKTLSIGAAFTGTFNLTGAANATTYTYDAIPSNISNIIDERKLFVARYASPYSICLVTSLDTNNKTITLDKTISTEALSNTQCYLCVSMVINNQNCLVVGNSVETTHDNQFIVGSVNALDSNALFVVANGDINHASNAFVVHEDGSANFQGTPSAGTVQNPASVIYTNDLTTKAYVDSAVSSVLPSSGNNGQVLMYNNGAWEPMLQEKSLQLPYQLIPLSFDGTNVSTTITPQDISEGYTLDGVDYPPYLRSSFTKADLLGSTILLTPVYGNADGYEFQSGIFDLTSVGFTGLNGLLRIETYNGYINPYQCTLVTWPASYPTPADIGAIPNPGGNNGQVLSYSNGTWAADDLNLMLNNEDAIQIYITENAGVWHINNDFATLVGAYLSCRKIVFLAVSSGFITAFEPVVVDQNSRMMVLASIGGVYNYQRLTFYPSANGGGMDGTLELIPTGADKITIPGSSQSGDVLTYNGSAWVASAPSGGLPAVTSADDGKIMQVVNGAWAAASLPSASGVSF